MSEFLYYDEDRFAPTCANCGGSDFKRQRTVDEVCILSLENGLAETVDSDLHAHDDWRIECERCGNSSDELEDILTELDEDEDESDEEGAEDVYRF